MRYTVLLKQTNGKFIARVPALPECIADGQTRDEAMKNIGSVIAKALEGVEVTTVEVKFPLKNRDGDPWMKVRGMFRDDPTWDEFIQEIQTYRREVDKQEWGME